MAKEDFTPGQINCFKVVCVLYLSQKTVKKVKEMAEKASISHDKLLEEMIEDWVSPSGEMRFDEYWMEKRLERKVRLEKMKGLDLKEEEVQAVLFMDRPRTLEEIQKHLKFPARDFLILLDQKGFSVSRQYMKSTNDFRFLVSSYPSSGLSS